MARFFCTLALSLALVWSLTSASAGAADKAEKTAKKTSYDYLESWVDAYPSMDAKTQKPLPKGQTFWDDPKVKASLKRAVKPWIFESITTCWKGDCEEQPIKKFQNYLLVTACMKSNCGGDIARIFFDLNTGKTEVCWRYTRVMEDAVLTNDYWWSGGLREFGVRGQCVGSRVFGAFDKRLQKSIHQELSTVNLGGMNKK